MSDCPKRLRRSITGMIFPRRLITPSTVSGALGTAVISGTRTISRTEPMRTPNVSFPLLRTGLGVLRFPLAMRIPLAASFRGLTARAASLRSILFQNKAVHAVQKVAGKFEHLLGGGGKLGRAGSGLLH